MTEKSGNAPSLVAATFFRDLLPDLQRSSDESIRDLSQGGAWLTGLATAFLALIFANDRLFATIGPTSTLWVAFPLLGVVFATVVQRLCHAYGAAVQRDVVQSVRARLGAMLLRAAEPWPPQEIADPQMGVAELQSFFGLDYSRLLAERDPHAAVNAAYSAHHSVWEREETARRAKLAQLLTAFQGKPRAAEDGVFSADDAPDLEKLRSKSRTVSMLLRIAATAYGTAGMLFALSLGAAIVVVARHA